VPPVNLALSAQFSLPHTRSTCVKRILLNLDCDGRKHAEVLQNHIASSLKLEKLTAAQLIKRFPVINGRGS
jgi:hypothetical protein